ncbi:MAG TPA: copper resistance CopC family protein [Burkholderiales bacterium]|nr:copper resistance CopC family protein [Burkholderiales bacterium]
MSLSSAAPLRARLRALVAILMLFAATPAWPHAVVVESDPAPKAALRAAPERVVLRFNVRIEQALSRATLKRGKAEPVALTPLDTGPAQTDRLVIPLPKLAAGDYELRYHVLATDGHTTQGVLRFTVLP